jgi:hypothetical protein
MRVISLIRDAFAKMKSNLTRINREEPLGRLSLAVIILLDLFILFSIFKGLAEHTAQLGTPDEYFPWTCREVLVVEKGDRRPELGILAERILDYDDDGNAAGKRAGTEMHPSCGRLKSAIRKAHDRGAITGVLKEMKHLNDELWRVRADIAADKPAYDTWLLESAADKHGAVEERPVANIKRSMRARIARQDMILGRLAELEKSISGFPEIMALQREIRELQKGSAALKNEYDRAVFWFPVKRLLMQFIFLLPLLVVFYLWYSRSARKARGLQTLVASHLLVVAFIPVLAKFFEMVYDIIPKKLLKAVWEFLVSMRLIALWHYLVIAITIFLALVLVYVLQKKVFSRERLNARRISKGQCQECGRQLPLNAGICPLCGFAQYTKCAACGESTFVHGAFCVKCGIRREGMSS